MNPIIETLNQWADQLSGIGWMLLWQSSLLIAILFVADLVLRRRVRAAVRYALWLAVLLKLVLPPTLALPTGAAWWLHSAAPPPAPPRPFSYTVRYGQASPAISPSILVTLPAPTSRLSRPAVLMLGWAGIGLALFGWMTIRWIAVARNIRRSASAPDWLNHLLSESQKQAGLHGRTQLKLTPESMSPAVCGLFRPVILLPQSLVEQLSPSQLRAVLLHELMHVRRADVWVNCAQALLQIVYWWHPLLWLANARIRQVREEAVDDAVMVALAGEADTYAPTLLEVARHAFQRPLASLGLVGILESRSALKQRIERLVNFRPPRKAGLTFVSIFGIMAFSALALPMGEAPVQVPLKIDQENAQQTQQHAIDDDRVVLSNSASMTNLLITRVFKLDPEKFKQAYGLSGKEPDAMTNVVTVMLRNFLDQANVDLSPPKSLYYADRRGDLFVRGTSNDIAAIESAVQRLNTNPVPIIAPKTSDIQKTEPLSTRVFMVNPSSFKRNVENSASWPPATNTAAMVNILHDYIARAGVDLHSPKALFYNVSGGLFVRATTNDLDVIESVVQTLNQDPPQISITTKFVELSAKQAKTAFAGGELTNALNWTLLLNSGPAARLMDQLLKQRGADLLAAPGVTTLGGRQARISVQQVRTIVTGVTNHPPASPQVAFTNDEAGVFYLTKTMEFGPELDVIPNVSADQSAITLDLTASVTDFMGYEDPKSLQPRNGRITAFMPRPVISTRKLTTSVRLLDGMTVVLGGASVSNSERLFDGSSRPVSVPPKADEKALFVFVTATIVDATGNRVHQPARIAQH